MTTKIRWENLNLTAEPENKVLKKNFIYVSSVKHNLKAMIC